MSPCGGTDGYPIRLPLKITSHLAPSIGTCSGLPPGAGPALAAFCRWLCLCAGLLEAKTSRTGDLGRGKGSSQRSESLGLRNAG